MLFDYVINILCLVTLNFLPAGRLGFRVSL